MSSLKDKLTGFEAHPPEGSWDRISAALDERPMYASKLSEYGETPPQKAWEGILLKLGSPAKVRTLGGSRLVWAVAATLLLAVSAWLVFNRPESPQAPGQPITSGPALPDISTPVETETGTSAEIIKTAGINPVVSGKIKSAIAKAKRNTVQNNPEASVTYAALQDFLPKTAERKFHLNLQESSDKYMIYSDSRGNAVRVPKKLFDAIACPDDRPECQQHLKRMQEKVASSALTSNFGGILDILHGLQENQ
jgi:hypothetical protein